MIATNESLLARLKGGPDNDAWRQFYDLYWSAILRYARKLGLNELQAQEALQETMVALIRILPRFTYEPERGRFRNFLLTIVHRKALAILRGTRRAAEKRDETAFDQLSENLLQHHQAIIDQEVEEKRWQESLLEDLLAKLSLDPSIDERTWEVFSAYVLEREPATAVAERFGMKPNAVYQIKNRLLNRLRAQYERLQENGWYLESVANRNTDAAPCAKGTQNGSH